MSGQETVRAGALRAAEEIDLPGYLPPFLASYRELASALCAEEPEFSLLWEGVGRVLANQFALTADAFGLARFEALLHLLPGTGDSLETRRARVLAALTRRQPYTVTWLRAWLDGLCGPDGHWEKVEEYTFDLRLDGDALIAAHLTALDIIGMLYPILPVNLVWCITTTLGMEHVLHVGGGVGADAKPGIHEMPDKPEFSGALHAAGNFSAVGEPGMRDKPDAPSFRGALHAGGGAGAQSERPVPENRTAPTATTILRTGGVTTILSNISKGE